MPSQGTVIKTPHSVMYLNKKEQCTMSNDYKALQKAQVTHSTAGED